MTPAPRWLRTAALAALAAGCAAPAELPTRVVALDEIEHSSDGPIRFADVRELVRTPHGLWVLDGAPPFVTFLPADDPSRPRRFGMRGSGPAELEAPVAMYAVTDGVVVRDAGRDEMVAFSAEGEVTRLGPIPATDGWARPDLADVTYVDPWRMRWVRGVLLRTELAGEVTWASGVARGALVAETGAEPERLFEVEFTPLSPGDEPGRGVFAAVPLWDACPEAVAVWSPRDEHVRFYSLEGRSVRQVRSPGAPTEVTLEGVENYLRLMARLELGPGSDSIDFRRRARDLKPAFGPRGPAFADLRCGSGAAVWLQRFDLQEDPLGRGPEWVRVAEGGEREAVRFPHEFKPFVFDDERVVGVVESAEGDLLASWRRSLVEVS